MLMLFAIWFCMEHVYLYNWRIKHVHNEAFPLILYISCIEFNI